MSVRPFDPIREFATEYQRDRGGVFMPGLFTIEEPPVGLPYHPGSPSMVRTWLAYCWRCDVSEVDREGFGLCDPCRFDLTGEPRT